MSKILIFDEFSTFKLARMLNSDHFKSENSNLTVWKCHDFSIAQILREINLGHTRSAKCVIITQLEALNYDFYEFLHFLRAEKCQKLKFSASKTAKMADF